MTDCYDRMNRKERDWEECHEWLGTKEEVVFSVGSVTIRDPVVAFEQFKAQGKKRNNDQGFDVPDKYLSRTELDNGEYVVYETDGAWIVCEYVWDL